MIEGSQLLASLLGGVLLGAAFFGALRWTVYRGVTARAPAVWFLGSALLRTGFCLVGFYFISLGDWHRLLLCLLGFLLARTVLLRPVQMTKDAP